ncbi:MAG: hypothetical protein ACRYFS_12890 [Janthinobacterium lividum]
MCGIAGVLYRDIGNIPQPVGAALMTLAGCLQHRGADSAGIAVFSANPTGMQSFQVVLPPGMALPEPQVILAIGGNVLCDLRPERGGFAVSRRSGVSLSDTALIAALEEALPGAVVTAMGHSLQIYKAVGEASVLKEEVTPLVGTHGIAHLRLATESKIDPAHAQPFWGRPFPDIAVTHNGHITNYHKMRQRFEARGFTFASHNDSEIIGTYLGDKMSTGLTLEQALAAAGNDLDGSFSFIVATTAGLGVLRDPFATKPLLFCETDTLVALASEQQALHHLLGEDIVIREIKPREVRVWAKD